MRNKNQMMRSDGQPSELELTANMLKEHAAEIYPDINESGQKHFVRVMMECAAETIIEAIQPRPLSEWHEGMGDKLWWRFPIEEAPYCGSPLDLGQTVEVVTRYIGQSENGKSCPVVENTARYQVGGWPGYHTHFTDIPTPMQPDEVHQSRTRSDCSILEMSDREQCGDCQKLSDAEKKEQVPVSEISHEELFNGWITLCVVLDPAAKTSSDVLFDHFLHVCLANGCTTATAPSQTVWGNMMRAWMSGKQVAKYRNDGIWYRGVRLVNQTASHEPPPA